MKLSQTTLLVIAVVAIGGYYFLVKKPADEKAAATPPPAGGPLPGAPPGSGLTETQQVLGGTAEIIGATGTAASDIINQIWPN